MDKAISLTLYLTLFLFFFFHLLKFPFQTIKAGTFSPNVTMHCELVEKGGDCQYGFWSLSHSEKQQ